MSYIKDLILSEIVRPEISSSNKTFLGTIQTYYPNKHVADVVTVDGVLHLNVQMAHSLAGIQGENPKQGDMVIITFMGGDMNRPYILSIINNAVVDIYTGKSTMMPDYTQRTGGAQTE